MAAALIESGHYAEARTEIQTALDYDPHHVAALNNLKMVSELDGKPAQIKVNEDKPGRLVSAWRRLWSKAPAEKQKNSVSTLASR